MPTRIIDLLCRKSKEFLWRLALDANRLRLVSAAILDVSLVCPEAKTMWDLSDGPLDAVQPACHQPSIMEVHPTRSHDDARGSGLAQSFWAKGRTDGIAANSNKAVDGKA